MKNQTQAEYLGQRLDTLKAQLADAEKAKDKTGYDLAMGAIRELGRIPDFEIAYPDDYEDIATQTDISEEREDILRGSRMFLDGPLAAVVQLLHMGQVLEDKEQWSIALETDCGWRARVVLKIDEVGDHSDDPERMVAEKAHAAKQLGAMGRGEVHPTQMPSGDEMAKVVAQAIQEGRARVIAVDDSEKYDLTRREDNPNDPFRPLGPTTPKGPIIH